MEIKPVPKSVSIFLDGEEISRFRKTIDDFFSNAKECIESVHDKSKPHEFDIRSGEINYSSHDSNDRLTYLLYDDNHVVACVVETRTTSNHLRFTFFRDDKFLESLT